MFDRLIDDVAGRFGLSADKARQLFGMLLATIFDQERGGFAGFIDQFRQKGLGHIAQSWVGTGPNEPISPSQVEDVFGASAIGDMAGKLGVGNSAVSGALSGLLPGMVNGLTDDGQIPTGVGIPDKLRGFVSGLGDWAGDLGKAGLGAVGAGAAAVGAGMHRVGDAAGDTTRAVGAGLNRAGDAISDGARAAGDGFGKLVPWLLIGALVVGAFLFFKGCKRDEATLPVADTTAPAADSMATDGAATTDAMGADAQAAADAAAAAAAANTATSPAGATTAPADAGAALDQLSGKQFSADELVQALNLMIIHFDTGSANISADSTDILKKAAEAIKAAPAGTKIEVGGHTDDTGNAAANQALSQRRAEAVVARLGELGVGAGVLGGKGYGQDKPVADNGTDTGRAQNRRIEFTVTP